MWQYPIQTSIAVYLSVVILILFYIGLLRFVVARQRKAHRLAGTKYDEVQQRRWTFSSFTDGLALTRHDLTDNLVRLAILSLEKCPKQSDIGDDNDDYTMTKFTWIPRVREASKYVSQLNANIQTIICTIDNESLLRLLDCIPDAVGAGYPSHEVHADGGGANWVDSQSVKVDGRTLRKELDNELSRRQSLWNSWTRSRKLVPHPFVDEWFVTGDDAAAIAVQRAIVKTKLTQLERCWSMLRVGCWVFAILSFVPIAICVLVIVVYFGNMYQLTFVQFAFIGFLALLIVVGSVMVMARDLLEFLRKIDDNYVSLLSGEE